jgi:DNA-binding HxlR family transcriptional regulator
MRYNLAKQLYAMDTIAEILTHLKHKHKINLLEQLFIKTTVFNKNLQQTLRNTHPRIMINHTSAISKMILNSEKDHVV